MPSLVPNEGIGHFSAIVVIKHKSHFSSRISAAFEIVFTSDVVYLHSSYLLKQQVAGVPEPSKLVLFK